MQEKRNGQSKSMNRAKLKTSMRMIQKAFKSKETPLMETQKSQIVFNNALD